MVKIMDTVGELRLVGIKGPTESIVKIIYEKWLQILDFSNI